MRQPQINPKHAEIRNLLRMVGPVVLGMGVGVTLTGECDKALLIDRSKWRRFMPGPDTNILKTNATLWAFRTLSLVLLFTGLPLFAIGWITIEMNTANPPSNLGLAMAFIGGGMMGAGALLGLVLACVMFRIMSRDTH